MFRLVNSFLLSFLFLFSLDVSAGTVNLIEGYYPSLTVASEACASAKGSSCSSTPSFSGCPSNRRYYQIVGDDYVYHYYCYSTPDPCTGDEEWDVDTQSCMSPPSCYSRRGTQYGSGMRQTNHDNNICKDGCTVEPYGISLGLLNDDGSVDYSGNWRYSGGTCSGGLATGIAGETILDGVEGDEFAPTPCPSGWSLSGSACQPDPGTTAPSSESGETACEISGDSCISFDSGVNFPPVDSTSGLDTQAEIDGTETNTGAGGKTVVSGGGGATSSGQSTSDLDGDGDTGSCDPSQPDCIQTNNGTVEGGLVCDVPPVCDGDDVLCAQLMQQYLQRCPNENFEQPTLGSTAEKLAEVTAEFNTEWNRVKSEAESKFSTSLSSGGSIPARVTSVFGVNIDFSISRFLPYLQIIANLIIAAAWIMAAGIVLSGRG